ncbi:polysaccharide deacetylase family protein [Natroniella acetigena]|uniref:polysaccharide deacetylase family protein n=1 Tax=Natroniella acetigena TaxID=52004 RepID=UPI00200A870A|nr:polysaccharide deacetylase family protein [Natroniella acetigena]MCK8826255.1 polysaccharide deacetylase family protein [Natroniella acetigena]
MDKRKVRFFYLPINRQVIVGLLATVILISFGMIKFNTPNYGEQPVFEAQNGAYYQGPTDQAKMSLAINVAWGEQYLPAMLDTLDQYQVKATFFFIGRWVEKFPELITEIEQRGHELGNHGFRHWHPKQLSKEELIGLIKDNEELIVAETGYKTDLFAPPYGEVDERIVEVAEELGYKTIMWTIDTIDWQRPSSDVILKRVIDQAENGGIVLMHPTEPTAAALSRMIANLQEQGYELVTVSELLE